MIVRKQKIITLSLIALFVIVSVIGAWAFKTNKFAGLADVIREKSKTASFGVLVEVKDGNTLVAGATVNVCPHSVADPLTPNCVIGSSLNGITGSNGQYDLGATNLVCGDPKPFTELSFYISKTGYNTTPYQTVNVDTYCSQKKNLYFNLTKGTVITPPPPPTPPATDKVDLAITVSDKSNYKPISGIPVVVDGATKAATDANGYVNIKEISAGNHKLEINPYGDADCNAKYTQVIDPAFVVKNQTINPPGGIGRQTTHYDLDLRDPSETFELQGKITGPDGSLLEGAKIEVACGSCSTGPWEATSTGEQSGYGNYQIKNIYNINRTGIPNDAIFAKINKDGFIYDPNNDGKEDSIVIAKDDIVWKFDHFEANKDIQMKVSPPKTFTVAGKVTNQRTGALLEDVKIIVKPQNVSAADPSSGTSTGHLEWPVPPYYANYATNDVSVVGNANQIYDVWVDFSDSPYDDYCDHCVINFQPSSRISLADNTISFDRTLGLWVAKVDIAIGLDNYLTVNAKDNSNSQPIQGAKVELFDASYHFSLSAQTNNQGDAIFSQQGLLNYCSESNDQFGDKSISIKISASGYVSLLESPGEYCDHKVLNFRLDRKDSRANTAIKGKVTTADIDPLGIAGAKVSLYPNPPIGDAIKNAATPASGEFAFNNLPAGDYVVSAFHLDYYGSPYDRIFVHLNQGEQIYVKILLTGSNLMSDSTIIKALVLAQGTLKPVRNIKIELEDLSEGTTEQKQTDDNGIANFDPHPIGRTYEARVQDHNDHTISRRVTLPDNWNNLSGQNQTKIMNNLIFIVDDGSAAPAEASFKMVVLDDTTGDPIADADVLIHPDSFNNTFSAFLRNPLDTSFSFYFEAWTNAQGKVTFMSPDFSIVPDENYWGEMGLRAVLPAEIITQMRAYKPYIGESLNVSLYKDGYNTRENIAVNITQADQTETIKLSAATGVISVTLENFLIPNGDYDADGLLDQVKIEKWDGNTYHVVRNPQKEISGSATVIFKNLAPGYYRARIDNQSPSDDVFFSGTEDAEITLGLCGKDAQTEIVKIDNSLYYVLADDRAKTLYHTNKNFFVGVTRAINSLRNQSKLLKPLVIIIGPYGEINAQATITNGGSCFNISDPYVMFMGNEFLDFIIRNQREDMLVSIMAHEYGHLVFDNLISNNPQFVDRWSRLFMQIAIGSNLDESIQNCIFNNILDGNVSLAPIAFGGHPGDALTEMFASFFNDYFIFHGRLHGLIVYHAAHNSSCQNILKYMWQLFAENIGKVYSDDNQMFDPVGGGVGNSTYSFSQIMEGKWLNSNYQALSLLQKAYLQFQRTIGPVIDNVGNALTRALTAFNNWLNSAMSSLHITDTGSVRGRLKYQDGSIIGDTVIMFGPRAVLTDARGNFATSGVPTGSQLIVAKKTANDNYEIISPDSKAVNITRNQTTRVDIIVAN